MNNKFGGIQNGLGRKSESGEKINSQIIILLVYSKQNLNYYLNSIRTTFRDF